MSFKRRKKPQRNVKKPAAGPRKKKPTRRQMGPGMRQRSRQLQNDGTTRKPRKPSGGKDDGFTGPTSDMGPTVHLPDELMPFKPTTMFA